VGLRIVKCKYKNLPQEYKDKIDKGVVSHNDWGIHYLKPFGVDNIEADIPIFEAVNREVRATKPDFDLGSCGRETFSA